MHGPSMHGPTILLSPCKRMPELSLAEMKAKKNLVILTPGFPKDEEDTTCLPFLQEYLLALQRLQPEVKLRVVAFQYPYNKGHYSWNGIPVYSAGGRSRRGINRLLTWLSVWRELKRICKQEGIDVIHSFWLTECSFIGQKFSQRNHIKQVAYAIGQDVLKTNRYLRLQNFKTMHVVAMSEAIAQRFKTLTGQDVRAIIAGGVNADKIGSIKEEKTIDIIGVGALSALKNYGLFIDVIAALKKNFPAIKACIVGRGEQESQLKQKAESIGLSDTLLFAGEVSHKEVFSYLGKSKIFLHTSGYEGQSTVIMEALAMGLHVVCFDVGRLHAENKISVCNSKEEMVKELERLLKSKIDSMPVVRTIDDMVNDFIRAYEL